MFKFSLFLMVAVWLGGCVIREPQDHVLDNREFTIPASGVTRLEVDAEAGWLEVIGEKERTDILLEAEFECHLYDLEHAEDLLDKQYLSHRVDGDLVSVESRTRQGGWQEHCEINLTMHVPAVLYLDINDKSGDLNIHGMGRDVHIHDSSGGIAVDGVTGQLTIEDSSGGIEVTGVGSELGIIDTSGGIDVRGVDGDVNIEDSSGDIDVRDVSGDFRVTSDGSGRVNYSGIEGSVSLPDQ